jgi:beta-aspartyl-peptidase (threonine type)
MMLRFSAIPSGMRAGLALCLIAGALVSLPLAQASWQRARRTAVTAQPPDLEKQSAADADAIRKVLADQQQAWNKGDLDGFMVGYWNSPDLSFYSASTKTKGWQATMERYRQRYRSEGQEMGQLTFSELDVQLLGADSGLVRGRWQLERSKDKPGGLFTLIVKRFPEGWRIVHDHTSSG